MKALFLFDIHYDSRELKDEGESLRYKKLNRRRLEALEGIEGSFDAVLLGGDNAEISNNLNNHRILFDCIRNKFNCQVGFVLGNHDLWGKPYNLSSNSLLEYFFPKLAKEFGFTYLENETLKLDRTTFVGTYGHYDYSFFRGKGGVNIGNILDGEVIFPIDEKKSNKLSFVDRVKTDWEGRTDLDVCMDLCSGFSNRLKSTLGEVVSISHTIPNPALNGWSDSPTQYFMEAYSGSKLIGDAIEKYGGRYHFCGHTHSRARGNIGETDVINVGSGGTIIRYVILENNTVIQKSAQLI